MIQPSIPHPSHPRQARKAQLVDLGLVFLTRSEWGMIAVITTIIRARRWQNA